MKKDLIELVNAWREKAEYYGRIASEEFRGGDWQMGNVDAATETTYKRVIKDIENILNSYE